MWRPIMIEMKSSGLNAIETYVFWNLHQPQSPDQYDFSGRLNLTLFLQTAAELDLYVILRIGPYICAEFNYGGFPIWLREFPGVEFRTYNSIFIKYMSQ